MPTEEEYEQLLEVRDAYYERFRSPDPTRLLGSIVAPREMVYVLKPIEENGKYRIQVTSSEHMFDGTTKVTIKNLNKNEYDGYYESLYTEFKEITSANRFRFEGLKRRNGHIESIVFSWIERGKSFHHLKKLLLPEKAPS